MTPPLQKTVWLVNQFVPPDRAPTARLLDELASGLMERGWNVRFIGCTQGYHTGPVAGWRRWWRDLKAHARLFIRSLTGCKPEVVVCLTDPPALVFTMACVALLRGARLVHWPMDVYPEIAAALGVISNRSLAYKIIKHAADWGVGRCASVVILDEDMRRLFGKTAKSACPVVAPWPPSELKVPDKLPAPAPMMIRWTYSGNLGRAHEYATLLQAQRKIEDQGAHFELVFQGGGASRQAAQELALELGLKNCHWADYSDDSELVSSLLLSHLSIATQRPEMKGLLWPSKLARSTCCRVPSSGWARWTVPLRRDSDSAQG